MLYKITQKKSKGFTLSEVVITMAVLAIFLAVTVPLFTLQKGFTGTDKDAADCITKGTFDIASTACKAALSKCERNKGNTCNTLLNLVSSYSDPALTVLGQACTNGGKQACGILINRCIDNSANCEVTDKTYDIHNYLALAATDTSIGKETMYNLLKTKMDLGISNIYDRVITDCQADSASMACTLIGHKVYQFNADDENDFIEMDPDYGTIFNNSKIQLTNDYWLLQYGGIYDDGQYLDTGWRNIVVPSADGNYLYVAGAENSVGGNNWQNTCTAAYVMKTNISNGSVVWKKHYGCATAAAMTVSGNYIYIAGDFWYGPPRSGEAFIAKLDDTQNGTVVWKKQYGGGASDFIKTIAVSGNNIYVAGSEYSDTSNSGRSEMLVMMVDDSLNGTAVWKKKFGGTKYDELHNLKVYGNYVYIVGWDSSDTQFSGADDGIDVYVAKLNAPNGTVVWEKHYGYQADDEGYDLVVSGNYVYVTGRTKAGYSIPGWDVLAMKLNDADDSTGGTIVWKKKYGQSTYNEVGSYIYAAGNYIYVSGYEDSGGNNDILLMKINQSDGSAVWKNRYGNTGDEKGQSLVVLGDYIYVAGFENSDAAGGVYDVVLMKINKNISSSNIGTWTLGTGGNGEDILNTKWGFNGGEAMSIDPARWISDGVDIKTPTTAADALWTTGEAETTGGTGTDITTWANPNGMDIGVYWTVNAAPITGWRPFYYYIMTSDTNHISGIKAKTISAAITQDTTPAGTNIKYLVSFDGRLTWQMYDGSAWQDVNTLNGLNDYTVATSGSTAAQIQTGLTNYTVPAGSSLDFAIYLLSSDNTATPYVDSIDIWYY